MNTLWSRTILILSIAGMQLSWLYAVFFLFTRDYQYQSFKLLVYGVFYFISYIINKLTKIYVRKVSIKYLFNMIVWTLGLLACFKVSLYTQFKWFELKWLGSLLTDILKINHNTKPSLFILLFMLAVLFLGLRFALIRVKFSYCIKEFQFGFSILLIAFLIHSVINTDTIPITPAVLCFFIFALVAMALSHAQEGKGWLAGNHSIQWFGFVIISTAFVIIAGLLVGMVINPDIMVAVYNIFMQAWQLVLKVLSYISGLFPDPEPMTLPSVDQAIPDIRGSARRTSETMDTTRGIVGIFVRIFWIILFLLVIKSISSQITTWFRNKMNAVDGVEVEAIRGGFRADLKRLLRYLLNKGKIIFRHIENRLKSLLGMSESKTELLSIRRIYAAIIKRAATEGFKRKVSQTPYNYLAELIKWRPHMQNELSFITDQYVSVRYGGCTPDKHASKNVRLYWLSIKQSRPKRNTEKIEPMLA